MYFTQAFTALLGFSSLVASAPTAESDNTPAARGLRWKTRAQKRAPLIIAQEIQETSVTIVEENLDTIAALEQVAEQEFAALVQEQLALVAELDTIKNNIRINNFKARWSEVNTVIVVVTTVVDSRTDSNGNRKNTNRYKVNQLHADNGKPNSEMVVMVSDAVTMTIGSGSPGLNVAGFLTQASAASAATAVPQVASFDSNAPFGQINQTMILPAGANAPTNAQVFADPAAIILPNQNVFVEAAQSFAGDCQIFNNNANSLFNLVSALTGSLQAAESSQSGSVVIVESQSQTEVVARQADEA